MSAVLAVAWQRLRGAACGGRAAALCRGLRTGPRDLAEAAVSKEEEEKQGATDLSTHVQVVTFDSMSLAHTSCGTEGFQNAKKATAIAAQTAAMAAAVKARGKGVLHVRVMVKGLGPGRKAAIRGLTMGGLEVISITDNTPVPHNGCRPRKARRM